MNSVMHVIHQLCKSSHIQLTATYLLGADNMVADCLSLLWPHHKWKLAPAMFCRLNQCWGPHTINRTASASNSQLPCFNSQFSEARSEAVDCLLQDWSKDNNWATPPIALILRILNLVERQCTMATIIVPKWPGCHWFSHLERLTINTPAHVQALARNFSSKSGVIPEPLCNKCWRWAAYRISGAGWLSAVANLLNNALAASTWKCYASNVCQFKVYCLVNDISFSPEQDEAFGLIDSFLESATRSSQQPSSMIASLSAATGALYKTTDFHPTCDPLLSQVKCALVCLHTTCSIEHGAVFDTSALRDLFLKWGASLSLQQLRTKLLAMLCMLGTLCVASPSLTR